MTGQQALQILQKPVFGDQQCIEARDVLRIVSELHSEKADSLKNLMKKDISVFLYSQFGYADESRS
jgi:hypothetical protein